jgi:hypothetical protein
MEFIQNIDDVVANLRVLKQYLKGSNATERDFANDMVRRGKTILVYKLNGSNHFAPSRFCGYKDNTMAAHLVNDEKDGRDTNPVLDELFGKAFYRDGMEEKFLAYCSKLGIEPHDNKRRYWRVGTRDNPYLEIAK